MLRDKAVLFILMVIIFAGAGNIWALDYEASGSRNPFESLLPREAERVVGLDKTLPNFTVSGLVWGSALPEAIINDEVYRMGDEVQGAKILDINKNGVTLLFDGKIYELRPKRKLE